MNNIIIIIIKLLILIIMRMKIKFNRIYNLIIKIKIVVKWLNKNLGTEARFLKICFRIIIIIKIFLLDQKYIKNHLEMSSIIPTKIVAKKIDLLIKISW